MTDVFGDIDRTTYVFAGDAPQTLEQLDVSGRGRAKGLTDRFSLNDAHFRLFVLAADDAGSHRFMDPHEVDAALEGSEELPDVRMRLNMLAFHSGAISLDKNHERATLRLDVGQNDMGSSTLNPLFWTIAAGLDLATSANLIDAPDTPKKYRDNFDAAFGRRPIELPGGATQLRFQVVSHPKEEWWQEIFRFLKSDVGDRLISAIGLPGVTKEAVKIIDQAFGMLEKHDIIFQSDKMDFSVTARARETYTMGMPGVEAPVMNPGFCLLAPHSFYPLITEKKPKFFGGYGRLAPSDWSLGDFHTKQDNPFDKMPYAVLSVRAEACSLYGGLGA